MYFNLMYYFAKKNTRNVKVFENLLKNCQESHLNEFGEKMLVCYLSNGALKIYLNWHGTIPTILDSDRVCNVRIRSQT